MNRFIVPLPTHRRFRCSTTVAALAIGALALAGCSSGQLSQTAAQVPAINGSQAVIHNVALRNVHIQAVQTGDFLRPGQSVDLVLVASNQSSDSADKLVGITTDIGTVTLSGNTQLPAGGMLFVGTPNGQNRKAVEAAKATVALNKPITNGLTYNFTFAFEKAGSTSLPVPISAPPAPPAEQVPGPAKHP